MNQSVAIVTGASQGIGRATSVRLARDFSAIVLVARNTAALAEVATAVKSVGAEPLICGLDLSKPEAPETLVRATLDRFGRIDALLNIAGAVPQIDLFEGDRRTVASGHGVEASRSAPAHDTCLGRAESFERLRGIHVRQRCARSKAWVCRCSSYKRCHHCSC